MALNLQIGMSKTIDFMVNREQLASSVGSGTEDVLATPSLIAAMENVAMQLVAEGLPVGMASVGVRIEADHIAATPMGMQVKVTATLIEMQGRKLSFEIEAFDKREKVGYAKHVRFAIDRTKFQKKADAKLEPIE